MSDLQNRIITNFIACVARNEGSKVVLQLEEVGNGHHTLDVTVTNYLSTTVEALSRLAKMYAQYKTHELLGSRGTKWILRIHFQF